MEAIYSTSLGSRPLVPHYGLVDSLPHSLKVELFLLLFCLGLIMPLIVRTVSLGQNALYPSWRRLQSTLILVPHIIELLLEQVLKVELLDAAELVPYVGANALSGRLLLRVQCGGRFSFGPTLRISCELRTFLNSLRRPNAFCCEFLSSFNVEGFDHHCVVISARCCFLNELRKFFIL